MGPHAHGRSSRASDIVLKLRGGVMLAIALALFIGIFVLRSNDPKGASDLILFVVPVALLALRFGFLGGLAGGLVGLGLVTVWDTFEVVTLSVTDYLSAGTAFLLLGTLLGAFVDRRRRLEEEVSRYHDASLDLLATADLDGRFTRVNPAWERLLGHSAETLCSRPFIEFVHPDDRKATIAETAALVEGSRDTVDFRNRYRATDGTYRCLEWTAHASTSHGAIYAIARDITAKREAEDLLADHATLLEEKIAERTAELAGSRLETLKRLALAAEYRDGDTYEHTERVGRIAAEIFGQLGLGPDEIQLVREAAPLHDIGKLGIPDSILLKPGPLTEQEYKIMQTHAELGASILSGSDSPVLQMAEIIARSHHERWEGTGYPKRLAGNAIPLVGRVTAVADVFDALTHDRPYKLAWTVEQAIAEIRRGAGSQFDPRVVDAFLTQHKHATKPEVLTV